MRKQAKSSTTKVRKICSQYSNEFLVTPAGHLRCNICDVLVKCDKKLFVASHGKAKHHQAGLQRKSGSQGRQSFLQPD